MGFERWVWSRAARGLWDDTSAIPSRRLGLLLTVRAVLSACLAVNVARADFAASSVAGTQGVAQRHAGVKS
jgi:hypothetical protein